MILSEYKLKQSVDNNGKQNKPLCQNVPKSNRKNVNRGKKKPDTKQIMIAPFSSLVHVVVNTTTIR